METEKKLQTIEEELKLLKGELKQTLSSVRDYLLNMELPTSGFSSILAALGDGGDRTVNKKGNFTLPPDGESKDEPKDKSKSKTAHEPSESEEEPLMPDSELPLDEEQQIEYEKISHELSQSVPKVNLLANLINWVSLARKEIGDEQLPTFLEVYGISGHLSPELKDVILHLADIITTKKPGDNHMAEIWSNSMLSLHGILTGGDAPLNPVRPHWNEIDEELEPDENEVIDIQEEPKEPPVKLKLVFPNGDGKGKEYCIDLTPEVDTNGSEN
jgi:hypothetical protein